MKQFLRYLAIIIIALPTVLSAQIPAWNHFPSGFVDSPTATMQGYVGGISSAFLTNGNSGMQAGFLWSPAVPITQDVANKANASTTPDLHWDDKYGAYMYLIQVSTSNTFADTIVNDLFSILGSQTSLSYTVSTSLATSTQYFWRVRAMHTGGMSVIGA
jgi:hypothetical protein